jgi:hypothetical protein
MHTQAKVHAMPIVEIYRVRVDPASVERPLAIHDDAVAEYQAHIPELLGVELVHSSGSAWAAAR